MQRLADHFLTNAALFNVAWRAVQRDGVLTGQHLLKELGVKRSSAVLAVLARLPELRGATNPPRIMLER